MDVKRHDLWLFCCNMEVGDEWDWWELENSENKLVFVEIMQHASTHSVMHRCKWSNFGKTETGISYASTHNSMHRLMGQKLKLCINTYLLCIDAYWTKLEKCKILNVCIDAYDTCIDARWLCIDAWAYASMHTVQK